jgi:pyridoxamine 5'-phosphate oxidase
MDPLSEMRREYSKSGLDRNTLDDNPFTFFETWLQEALEAKLTDPTAMTVATVDEKGQPSQRIVLLKDVSQDGFVFYTNTESRKASELKQNPKISLHFPWHVLERQVKVCGQAQPLSAAEVEKYFMSRPKSSQLAAWASEQSRPIASKQLLIEKFNQIKQKFSEGEVPLPSFWGGYRVIPHEFEFWQGGEHRLHDNFIYRKQADNSWKIERLMP